jgi:N-acetylglucosaminyl-diphospho-decaprenol L-rhamnosyltransferase
MWTTGLVSAVIVNHNGASYLSNLLQSLEDQRAAELEIMVVDNASMDDSGDVVSRSSAMWIPLSTNIGLAHALHQGALRAKGEFLLFLNNDLIVEQNCVAELVKALTADPNAFAADTRQVEWSGDQCVHGRSLLQRVRGFAPEGIYGWTIRQRDVEGIEPCAVASAGAMMVRSHKYFELGGWDVRFPIGYEDFDLSLRAWARGWSILHVPTAIVRHDVSASARSAQGSRFRGRGICIGRILFAEKHLPLTSIIWGWARACAALTGHVASGRWYEARIQLEALGVGIKALPGVARERLRLRRSTQLSAVARLSTVASV